MGRVITPLYRIEYTTIGNYYNSPQEWQVKGKLGRMSDGKPTTENINIWVAALELSFIEGCNKHIGYRAVTYARIIHQKTGETVAEWNRLKNRPDEPVFATLEAIAGMSKEIIGPEKTAIILANAKAA